MDSVRGDKIISFVIHLEEASPFATGRCKNLKRGFRICGIGLIQL